MGGWNVLALTCGVAGLLTYRLDRMASLLFCLSAFCFFLAAVR